jgi:predicted SAM-dependent methyltransferase
MIYAITNNAPSLRVFYDAAGREVKLAPRSMRHVDLDDGTYMRLVTSTDFVVNPATFARHAQPVAAPAPAPEDAKPAPIIVTDKPPVVVTGHFGIGDNIHQRAVMRELMKSADVWLYTCHYELYHDLIAQGLKLVKRPTSLHAQRKTMERESAMFAAAGFAPPPLSARRFNIGYPKVLIDQHGSILEAQFSCVGLKMPERPDFSLPIKPEWRQSLHERYNWSTGGKPLMVHRPIVVRNEWNGRSRNPDPAAYDQLYRSIRDQFFVISIADLEPSREWIEGPHQDVDLKLHKGELSFPEMAAVFAEADLVFCNAGFAPVLAQAVGTPSIVVYGGRESFRTTQRIGTHLAPTCPIDVINPCDCHSATHGCDKRIDVPKALASVAAFVEQCNAKKILLFGTFYVDSPDRDQLTDLWKQLHVALNEQDCDFLAIDSQSPLAKFADWTPYDGKRHPRTIFNFPDNIGHLSRAKVTAGKDGWGRAFCKGLEIACELGYDYAVHIEGDSLFRLKVADVVAQMRSEGIEVASTAVEGMRIPGSGNGWCETGLMFFSTAYVKRSNFIARYDWPNRRVAPTPERVIRQQILERDLDAKTFRLMPWKALRADRNQITKDNVLSLNLDWITHQHDSAQQDVYRRFAEAALSPAKTAAAAPPQPSRAEVCLLKLNLGCGTNKLAGWVNHDADVDITKRLPWATGSASHISIEHCVEHVAYKKAIDFFKEAHRVLAQGGVLRVTVPSLEQIAQCEEADYHRFTTKWQQLGPTKRGAMHAIIYAHGHETAWNVQLLKDTLYFAGFDDVRVFKPGESDDPVLRGVEGHGKVISDKFNLIESCTCEARKGGSLPMMVVTEPDDAEVAIVIGGAECWQDDLEEAKQFLIGRNVRYYLVNDQIKSFPERGVACTLHPDKLNGHANWLGLRRKAGLPEPDEIWAHMKHASITHDTKSQEWRGSTGLFAVQVAHFKHGHNKVIGCGIPMVVDAGHFERHQKWQSAISFREGWIQHHKEIKGYFRSMSGWTAEQFGKPDEAWLSA